MRFQIFRFFPTMTVLKIIFSIIFLLSASFMKTLFSAESTTVILHERVLYFFFFPSVFFTLIWNRRGSAKYLNYNLIGLEILKIWSWACRGFNATTSRTWPVDHWLRNTMEQRFDAPHLTSPHLATQLNSQRKHSHSVFKPITTKKVSVKWFFMLISKQLSD